MTIENFISHIVDVVEKCVVLKNMHVQEKDLPVDYICLFSHTQQEYDVFLALASQIGTMVDETKTGPVFQLNQQISTSAGSAKVLKIRTPDVTKPQLGDVDFTTDYPLFKQKYMNQKGFTLIVREKFEMLELNDEQSDVLVYFSSIPPSTLVGVV